MLRPLLLCALAVVLGCVTLRLGAESTLRRAVTEGSSPAEWMDGRFSKEGVLYILTHPKEWYSRSLGQEFDFALAALFATVAAYALVWVFKR